MLVARGTNGRGALPCAVWEEETRRDQRRVEGVELLARVERLVVKVS